MDPVTDRLIFLPHLLRRPDADSKADGVLQVHLHPSCLGFLLYLSETGLRPSSPVQLVMVTHHLHFSVTGSALMTRLIL